MARARLGAGWPKLLLQGIINSGVSQGHLVFIKLRQLNTVAALKCYNWKVACDDVHREGPAARHRGGPGGQGHTSPAGPGQGRTVQTPSREGPCPAETTHYGHENKGWGEKRRRKGTCPIVTRVTGAVSSTWAGPHRCRPHCAPAGPWWDPVFWPNALTLFLQAFIRA